MTQLPNRHPAVHTKFIEGNFVVQRSEKKFSLMCLEQSEKHSIKFLKEDSGLEGLYGHEAEKAVIELSKPNVIRVIEKLEHASINIAQSDSVEQPESSVSDQQRFLNQLKRLLDLVDQKTIIDHYVETDNQLITLDIGEYMAYEVSRCLKELPTIENKTRLRLA